MTFWELYGEATRTSLGFFWKAGWAFVLGYAISGMIRAFVPKARLAPAMGEVGARSFSAILPGTTHRTAPRIPMSTDA